MAPTEHITWFEDNIRWYESLRVEQLEQDIPSCPGWSVEYVLNHLAVGLALAYPVAMSKPPSTQPDRAFDGVEWPTQLAHGIGALDLFSANMAECVRQFKAVDPQSRCWTYEGPGVAAFWFRRAAIETTLHRMDVAEAIGAEAQHLDDLRAADAIVETLEFALPLASDLGPAPDGEIVVQTSCLDTPVAVGTGDRVAQISGEPHDVLNALWGRHRERVTVDGDHEVARSWLAAIETAFAGR